MDRLQQFETMLEEIQNDFEMKSSEIEKMKVQGKDKTATFKQYLADKLMYQRILALYKKHGLIQ